MSNLIENAFKFSRRGGLITVSVTHLEGESSVRIVVTDTGVGIAPVHTIKILYLLFRSQLYLYGRRI